MSHIEKTFAGLFVVAALTGWIAWNRSQQQLTELERDIAHLRDDLQDIEAKFKGLKRERDDAKWDAIVSDTSGPEEQLERALENIGHKNILIRYQATRTIKKHGGKATEQLIATLDTGNKAAKETALLLLGYLRDPKAAAGLRSLAVETDNHNLRAGALTVLAKLRDAESRALFVDALGDSDKRVRAAALTGVRRMKVYEAIVPLLAMLQREDEILSNEVQRCLKRLTAADPEEFGRAVGNLPGDAKFKIIQLFARSDDEASTRIVRSLLDDVDPRVALTAARVLARDGDEAAKSVATRFAKPGNDETLRDIARQILDELEVK